MRTLRLLFANLLCRLAAAVAGQGVILNVRLYEPLPPHGYELSGPSFETPGVAWVAYE